VKTDIVRMQFNCHHNVRAYRRQRNYGDELTACRRVLTTLRDLAHYSDITWSFWADLWTTLSTLMYAALWDDWSAKSTLTVTVSTDFTRLQSTAVFRLAPQRAILANSEPQTQIMLKQSNGLGHIQDSLAHKLFVHLKCTPEW